MRQRRRCGELNNNTTMMNMKYTLAALAATTLAANAAVTLVTKNFGDYNASTDSQGNPHGFSASLADDGWSASGGALTPTMKLNSVSLIRDASNSSSDTNGALVMAVMTTRENLATVVAWSTNTQTPGNDTTQHGITQTWTFGGDLLTSSTEYYYILYSDAAGAGAGAGDASDTAIARIRVPFLTDILDGDTLTPNDAVNNNDVYIGITATAVPEPSSSALLGLGGLALILRRRK